MVGEPAAALRRRPRRNVLFRRIINNKSAEKNTKKHVEKLAYLGNFRYLCSELKTKVLISNHTIMEQKTIQISIEEKNGIQSFMIYQIRYTNKGDDAWHFWLSYLDKKRALLALRTLRNLPDVDFACIDSVQVFI